MPPSRWKRMPDPTSPSWLWARQKSEARAICPRPSVIHLGTIDPVVCQPPFRKIGVISNSAEVDQRADNWRRPPMSERSWSCAPSFHNSQPWR